MVPNKITDIDKFRGLPFWAWNDKLEIKELISQIDWLHKNGVGGFIIHARSGLITEYLADEWMECIETCINHANELGMQAWIYDENGWPSGFAGGKLLDDIENHDRYLTFSVGAYDENALVSYIDKGESLVRSNGKEEGNYINIFEHYSTSTADILNPDVTDEFIKLTHNAYKERFGDNFKKVAGFFTDEPQYYRWDTPYTKMLIKHFKEKYNEDILDNLGLLFFKKQGFREFRYKYWSGLQELLLNNFSKRVYDWCDQNDAELTGHYIEETALQHQMMCCAGIMPFYEYEHVLGIDWLGRYCDSQLTARQLSSVAEQLGKERTLGEIYAAAGWDVTPRELKNLTELLYFGGVRVTCHHTIPYSSRGMRGHDYPAHYSKINPWVRESFKDFNDYFANLSAFLSENREQIHVAILHPIKSTYFYYSKRYENPEDDITAQMNIDFCTTVGKLEERNIQYHFIDETVLSKHGYVEDKYFCCGKCKYDFIIIPKGIETMEETTEELLHKYVNAGGKVIVDGEKPKYITWKPYDYDYLVSNTDYDAIEAESQFICRYEGGHLFVSTREGENGTVIFAINHSRTDNCLAKFDFGGKYTSLEKSYVGETDTTVVPLEFILRPNESAILIPSNKPIDETCEFEVIVPKNTYTVLSSEKNSLTIDNPQYSTDGENYSDKKYFSLIFKELLDSRFEGDLYLKYNFQTKTLPKKLSFRTGLNNIKNITVNGNNTVLSNGVSENIADMLVVGDNDITVTLNYWQREYVYNVLYGENITEGLINCLYYDSEIEPVIIEGDFGVYEKNGFTVGRLPNIRIGKDFYIGDKLEEIDSLVSCGFPFFSGKITLKQDFECKTDKVVLKLPFRWQVASVTVNGKKAGTMLLDDQIDISKFVNVGKNELKLELVISARNLYGPHHLLEEESDFSTPDSFNVTSPANLKETYAFVEALYSENA